MKKKDHTQTLLTGHPWVSIYIYVAIAVAQPLQAQQLSPDRFSDDQKTRMATLSAAAHSKVIRDRAWAVDYLASGEAPTSGRNRRVSFPGTATERLSLIRQLLVDPSPLVRLNAARAADVQMEDLAECPEALSLIERLEKLTTKSKISSSSDLVIGDELNGPDRVSAHALMALSNYFGRQLPADQLAKWETNHLQVPIEFWLNRGNASDAPSAAEVADSIELVEQYKVNIFKRILLENKSVYAVRKVLLAISGEISEPVAVPSLLIRFAAILPLVDRAAINLPPSESQLGTTAPLAGAALRSAIDRYFVQTGVRIIPPSAEK